MNKREEVADFLRDFKEKLKVWDILFRDDRGKFSIIFFRSIGLISRSASDCAFLYGGPDMWIFGKMVKKKEVYIKITQGMTGSSVLCISFHIAEHSMIYPLAKQQP